MHVGSRVALTARIEAFDRVAEIGDQGVIQEMHTGGLLTVRMDDGRPQFPHRNEVTVLATPSAAGRKFRLAGATAGVSLVVILAALLVALL